MNYRCPDYVPWKAESEIVLIEECIYFEPFEFICTKPLAEQFDNQCPWHGRPFEEEYEC